MLTAIVVVHSPVHSIAGDEARSGERIAPPIFQMAQAQDEKKPDEKREDEKAGGVSEPPPKTFSAKELMARGDDFNARGDFDRAIADYDTALKIDPALAEALNSRAMTWRAKGDRRRALADLDAALRLKPDFGIARANRKVLFQEIERAGAQMPLKPKAEAK